VSLLLLLEIAAFLSSAFALSVPKAVQKRTLASDAIYLIR